MLNDKAKLEMFDDLVSRCENLEQAYDEQSKTIAEMSKSIWQAKRWLDQANASLLAFIEIEDDEKPKRKRKKS